MTQEPMTDEERDFAELHYDMVHKFLHFHRLPEDEFYDVVIFGYLEAVQRNFRVFIDPEKRNFPALAKLCMKTAVCREIRAQWLEKRKANAVAVSLDCPSPDDESFSFHDIVPDETRNVLTEVENADLIRRALSVATAREREVLAYLYSGFSLAEISQIVGLNIHSVHMASTNLHAKARPIKDGNPPGLTSQQRYYETHKAEYAERNKAYRNAHKAEIRAYRRRYRSARKDERNAKRRAGYWTEKAASNAPDTESGIPPCITSPVVRKEHSQYNIQFGKNQAVEKGNFYEH